MKRGGHSVRGSRTKTDLDILAYPSLTRVCVIQANYINKVYRMDFNRQTGALRMLDNMMPDVSA